MESNGNSARSMRLSAAVGYRSGMVDRMNEVSSHYEYFGQISAAFSDAGPVV